MWQNYIKRVGFSGAMHRTCAQLKTHIRPLHTTLPHQPHFPSSWQSWKNHNGWQPPTQDIINWLKLHDQDDCLARALATTQGGIECWGHLTLNFAENAQINWHKDPQTGHTWPLKPAHQAFRVQKGTDIKTIWEASRFDFVSDFIRAHLKQPKQLWADSFWTIVEDWDKHNPFGFGVHWSNGQEIAIRALNILWGLHHLPTQNFAKICKILWQHGHAIAYHHPFTKIAVPNNHTILEATALLHLSQLMPWMPKSTKWHTTATQSLHEAINTQFTLNGAYTQQSHTYHRLSIWALIRCFPLANEVLRDAMNRVFKRSLDTLMIEWGKHQGQLPCFGPNDGARWPTITRCDYRDFRPLCQTLHQIIYQRPLFEPGPWDEAVLWCQASIKGQVPDTTLLYPASNDPETPFIRSGPGKTIIRRDQNTFGVLIHGPKHSPFGQDDLMHVDLTWAGEHITLDRGSHRYTGHHEIHHAHHGAMGHNAITLDHQGARHKAGYFSWWDDPKTQTDIHFKKLGCQAHRTGFVDCSKTSHQRTLTQTTQGWCVEDLLHDVPTTATLRWFLPEGVWHLEEKDGVWHLHIQTEALEVLIQLTSNTSQNAPCLESTTWSPYYGGIMPALLLSWHMTPSHKRIHCITQFKIDLI